MKVRFENYGLATNMHIDIFPNTFQRKDKNKIKKTISVESPKIKEYKEGKDKIKTWSNYSINSQCILANQLTGFGPEDF